MVKDGIPFTAGGKGNGLPVSLMRLRLGFTLLEILLVVAIIGIVAAVAYPAYQEQMRKSRRGQVKADLSELAQILERNFTEANRYDQNSAGVALAIGTAPLFNQSPRTGTAHYSISLPTLTASTFTLSAAPNGPQTGDPCGTYTLNQAGARGVTGGTRTVADCW